MIQMPAIAEQSKAIAGKFIQRRAGKDLNTNF